MTMPNHFLARHFNAFECTYTIRYAFDVILICFLFDNLCLGGLPVMVKRFFSVASASACV